ncbi:MAG: hypothetical protein RLZZ507_4750 [Cyanobacteriota bacterium]|jgi:hypothetical protein
MAYATLSDKYDITNISSTKSTMTKKQERSDQDSPWKEILEAYLPQAIEFLILARF